MRKTCLGEPFNNNKRWRSGQQKVVKLCANPASGLQSGCHLAAKSPSAAFSATAFTLAQLKPRERDAQVESERSRRRAQ
jgi:hypothetical protein